MEVALNHRPFFRRIGYRILLSLLCIGVLASAAACSRTSTPPPAGGQGTLNLADFAGPLTLDPATAAEATSVSYIIQVFSGLVRLDENLQVAPDIAQSWDKSADGKTYTFHLRQDVKFHDGKQVRASDFKYSWERALNPATQSLTVGAYLFDIVGSENVAVGETTQLSGVKVLDNYTLQVTIKSSVPFFLQKLAFPIAFVVDKANVESDSLWWQHPNGSGPFKLKEWQTDRLIVLQRNDSYYGEKAKLSEVVFQLYRSDEIPLYQEGSIDVAFVSPAYMGLVTDPTNPVSEELTLFPQLLLYYISFNTARPPLDDVNVRQAFCYAVDKERLIALATMNVVPAAYGILPPGMPGYNASLQGLHFDVQKAKDLISESKYHDVSGFPPIVLTTGGWGGDVSGLLGGVIEEWKRNLGIEVTVRQLEPEAYTIIFYSLKQERDELFDSIGGWIADYPDPQDFLDLLFYSSAPSNTGSYSNPEVDALLDKAYTEQDPATRLKLYQDAEQLIVQDAAVLPLFFGQSYVLVKPYVKDYVLSPLGYPLLNKVSIQE